MNYNSNMGVLGLYLLLEKNKVGVVQQVTIIFLFLGVQNYTKGFTYKGLFQRIDVVGV